jgi:hypothetical protein
MALDRIETIGELFKVRNMKLDLLGTKVLRKLKTVEQATTLGKIFGQFPHSAEGRAGAISVRVGRRSPSPRALCGRRR